jgi:N-acetylglutamate synthase-like GNAT family acetyltransferase
MSGGADAGAGRGEPARGDLVLTPIDGPALQDLVGRLRAAGLPSSDLAGPHKHFYAAESGAATIGWIGLEVHGSDALLRSFLVEERHRRRGHGRAIIKRLLDIARAEGMTNAWLLTLSLDRFFVDLGFEVVDRGAAPPSIAASEEFAGLCPASAICLRRTL